MRARPNSFVSIIVSEKFTIPSLEDYRPIVYIDYSYMAWNVLAPNICERLRAWECPAATGSDANCRELGRLMSSMVNGDKNFTLRGGDRSIG